MKKYEPTTQQEQAIREYLHEAVIPLIEDVLVKKLGQAMSFCSKELKSAEVEKQEPVACPYPCGWDNLFSIIIKKGAYLSTSTIDDEKPLSDHQRQEMMSMIDYARTLASWGKSTRAQTAPPKREWVGLNTTEAEALIKSHWGEMKGGPLVMNRAYIRDIEAKLKEKNT